MISVYRYDLRDENWGGSTNDGRKRGQLNVYGKGDDKSRTAAVRVSMNMATVLCLHGTKTGIDSKVVASGQVPVVSKKTVLHLRINL